MSNSVARQDEDVPTFEWRNHISLFVGAATATLICLKVFAVAQWDMNTAFGLLAENGAANVLIGSLLVILPMMSVIAMTTVAPWAEARLSARTPVERAAARLLVTLVGVLFVLIAPFYFILVVLGVWLFWRAIQWVRAKRNKRKRHGGVTQSSAERPRRFKPVGVFAASVFVLMFSSLPTPWLPSETVELEGEEVTVYVLNSKGETTAILLDSDRSIAQIDTELLTGQYCHGLISRISYSLPVILQSSRYPDCPH